MNFIASWCRVFTYSKSLIFVSIAILFFLFIPTGVKAAEDSFASILHKYRQLIVLFNDSAPDENRQVERREVVGRIIYHQNRKLIDELRETLLQDLKVGSTSDAYPAVEAFLGRLEQGKLFDADRLAFKGLLDDLNHLLGEKEYAQRDLLPLRIRVAEDAQALNEIQQYYDAEISLVFSRFQTRAINRGREAWNDYLVKLLETYSATSILAEYDPEDDLIPTHRGGATGQKRREYFGLALPKKTVVLTFDDGPHYRHTKRILDILKEHGIQAVFFQVGRNLGKQQSSGKIKWTSASAQSKQILEAGSLLANHSYSHPVLSKLETENINQEIDQTNSLLKQLTGQEPALFRPPYGARNDTVLARVAAYGLKPIMWNVDSKDWADPVPRSVARRVLDTLAKQERGIILLHDIQPQTVEALPLILKELKAQNFQFASWDGSSFSVPKKEQQPIVQKSSPLSNIYRESWAVIIGIDEYRQWPKLKHAVNDAQGIRTLLIDSYGFKSENVFVLTNEEATRSNILALLNDKLADPQLVKKQDRVFFFYAGHGATRQLPSGRELGYIIPVEADYSKYYGQAISMSHIDDIAEAIPAKHLFFIMDSCYSGLALTRSGAPSAGTNYVLEVTKRNARQMLTAGGANQQVADGGPNGHSVFTWTLMQGLQGKGDMNADGYITASELAAYVSPVVSSISLQTPAFGNLVGSEGGDFVFTQKHTPEFLNEDSKQLSQEEQQLADKVLQLKQEIDQKRQLNQNLQTELESAQQTLESLESIQQTAAAEQLNPAQMNKKGLQLFREKQYADALVHFLAAIKRDPGHIEAMNNLGFVYYKLEQYKKSVSWLEKVTLIDPMRAVAWLNLGDSYNKLGHSAKAVAAYQRFLQMKPKANSAVKVRGKIAAIEQNLN